MQCTGTDRVHLHVCRKCCPLAHLHNTQLYTGRRLIIDYYDDANGDFAPSRLHHSGLLYCLGFHQITPLSMMTRATFMSYARDVHEVQSAIFGIGDHSNAVL